MKSWATVDSSAAKSTQYAQVPERLMARIANPLIRGFESHPVLHLCIPNVMAA